MKLPFAMKNGRMVTPDEVDGGLDCGCICPNCGEPVLAKKGSIRIHHFAHLPSGISEACDPASARESAIHLMAKQIIAETKALKVPSFTHPVRLIDLDSKEHESVAVIDSGGAIRFERVIIERQMDGFRPDLVAYDGLGHEYLIEIVVTHRSSREKIDWLRQSGRRCIEITLPELEELPSRNDVIKAIREAKTVWLSHPDFHTRVEQVRRELKERMERINAEILNRREQNRRKALEKKMAESGCHAESRTGQAPSRIGRDCGKYDPRWFRCRNCGHVFSLPLSQAPCDLTHILCPGCGERRPVNA